MSCSLDPKGASIVYRPGDPPPEGYSEWHEWAQTQYRAGLRQRRCQTCLRWRFPQERCCEEVNP